MSENPANPADITEEAIQRFWSDEEAIAALMGHQRLIVAVSGGLDSMALLWLMREAFIGRMGERRPGEKPPAFVVAHVNHHLRGPESDADEMLVRKTCEETSLPFVVQHIAKGILQRGDSLERSARDARYALLREVAVEEDCTAIVTAHHENDLAETFLLRLLRGSGLSGLGGFSLEHDLEGIRVLRPLIAWSRKMLADLAADAGISWREDASNADLTPARNRIRSKVLPELERWTDHPSAASMIARTARRLDRERRALEVVVDQVYKSHLRLLDKPRIAGMRRSALMNNDGVFCPYLLRRLVQEVLQSPYPPSEACILDLMKFLRSGKKRALHQSESNVVAWLDRCGDIWFYKKSQRNISRQDLLTIFAACEENGPS